MYDPCFVLDFVFTEWIHQKAVQMNFPELSRLEERKIIQNKIGNARQYKELAQPETQPFTAPAAWTNLEN